ncbi:MAG: apolipoprotein N-acyltransferase [Actinobacteria bacterium]|nr:apolipoprotein N-acyltransferase [Actinomycetota bacterium]
MVIAQSFFAGFLLFTSFAPFNLWWLAPISLALLLHLLSDRKIGLRLKTMFLFGIGFLGPLLSWSNTYVGNLPWLLLVLLETSLLLPLALIPFSRHRSIYYFIFPSALVAAEGIQSRFPFGGFGWGRVAFSQADAPYVHVLQRGGVPSLTFTVAFISISILFAIRRNTRYVILVSLIFVSATPLFIARTAASTDSISIVAIQGGVPVMGLDFNARAREVFNLHVEATHRYLSKVSKAPDLVLWPENAADIDPLTDAMTNNDLRNIVDHWKVPIILGAVLNNGRNFSNASILWVPNKGALSVYLKQHLTPFGEYMPWRRVAEVVSPYAKRVIDFLPGNSDVIHKVGKARIAPIICFELIDDSLGRKMARNSNVLLVQTNSATFGTSAETDQQLAIARIRAIEHGRNVVSISTTGISAIVDSHGRVLIQTKKGKTAYIATSVPLINQITFSDRNGGVIEVALCLIGLGFLLISGVFFRLGRRTKLDP